MFISRDFTRCSSVSNIKGNLNLIQIKYRGGISRMSFFTMSIMNHPLLAHYSFSRAIVFRLEEIINLKYKPSLLQRTCSKLRLSFLPSPNGTSLPREVVLGTPPDMFISAFTYFTYCQSLSALFRSGKKRNILNKSARVYKSHAFIYIQITAIYLNL